jgi:hypothetical protein
MKFSSKLLSISLIAIVSLSACKLANDDEHLDIGSFRIIANGEVIAQQNGTEVTGSISVARESTSGVMSLEFRDPDGNVLTITDDDLYLEIDTNNPGVVLAQNSNQSRWAFTLTGVGPGSAAITVKLMHGSHADFESRSIPVTVN